MIRIVSTLRSEDVLLFWIGLPGVEVRFLENDGGVAEDEIDGAVDVAFPVELPERVNVEGVLVGYEAALVEYGEVGPTSQCHCLVFAGARIVFKCYPLRYKICTYCNCN